MIENKGRVVIIIACAVLSYIIQSNLLLNEDVSSLLYYTKQFINGGKYVSSILETNPPMIFFIYAPVCMFAKMAGLKLAFVLRMYIILLASISIILCSGLIKKIFDKNDYSLQLYLLISLLFMFLLLPLTEFGQREHIMLILIMPYVLTSVLVLQNKSIHPVIAVLVGIMAGFGFGLKPYFLFTLILIELYIMVYKRNVLSWARNETLICACMLVFYLAYVFYFEPAYINVMLPLLSQFYYMSIEQSWLNIFTNSTVIFCFFVLGLAILFYRKQVYRELTAVLLLTLMGLIFAFIVTRAAWWYHVLPAFSISCLLITMMIYQYFSPKAQGGMLSHRQLALMMLAGFVVPFILIFQVTRYAIVKNETRTSSVLTHYLAQSNAKSIYCFSSKTNGNCFPLAYVTHKEFVGRFPYFWWLLGLMKLEYNGQLTQPVIDSKTYLLDAVADDLNKYRPDLILINKEEQQALHRDFNMVTYFSKNEKFKQAWMAYHNAGNVGIYVIYERANKK